MGYLVVIHSGRMPDEGAVLTFREYGDVWRFVRDWQARHTLDRLSVFTSQLEPLLVLDAALTDQGDAHSGSRASGTLS